MVVSSTRVNFKRKDPTGIGRIANFFLSNHWFKGRLEETFFDGNTLEPTN